MRVLTAIIFTSMLVTGGISKVSAAELLNADTVSLRAAIQSVDASFNCDGELVEIIAGFLPGPRSIGLDGFAEIELQVELSGLDGKPLSDPYGGSLDPIIVKFPFGGRGLMVITADQCGENDDSTRLYVNGVPAGTNEVHSFRTRLHVSFKYADTPKVRSFVAAYLNVNAGMRPVLDGTMFTIRDNQTTASRPLYEGVFAHEFEHLIHSDL